MEDVLTIFLSHLGTGFDGGVWTEVELELECGLSCVDGGEVGDDGRGSGCAAEVRSLLKGAGRALEFKCGSSHFKFTTALGIKPRSLSVLRLRLGSDFLYSMRGGEV